MNRLLLATLVITSLAAATARADPPGLTPVVPTEGQGQMVEFSYRSQVALCDLGAVGLTMAAGATNSMTAVAVAGGAYALGAPIVHFVHGHPGRGTISLALRLGLPLMLGSVLSHAARPGSDGEIAGAAYGVLLGAVAASAIDVGFLAHGHERAPSWSPTVSATQHGGTVGFAKTF